MHEIGIEWMTQTEVNGHFLELRGIPDEKLEWERIPEAIAGANYYNIQNIPGQLTVEPDSGKIYLKIQYVTGADIRETTITDALGRYLEEEMAENDIDTMMNNLSMGGISESDRKGHRKSMAAAGGRKDLLFCGRQIFDGL